MKQNQPSLFSANALFAFILAGWMVATAAAAPSGKEIMESQKKRHETAQEYEKVKMVLIDSGGKQEVREMVRYAKKGPDGLYKYLVQFLSPVDVRGTGLLTWQQKGREDDQWLYLPALGQKLKRIAGGGKKSYFMGTDFAYEDLRSEKLEDHAYQVLREEAAEGRDCYVIEALPSTDEEKKSTGYGKRQLWIAKDTLVTVKADYYDHSMKLMKTATSYDIKLVKGDAMRAGKILMRHHQNKHQTLTGTLERKVDESIDDAIFTERSVLSFK